MKKILICSLSLSILLVGCGEEKNQISNSSTSKETKSAEKYISDNNIKNEFQKTVDAYSKELNNLKQVSSSNNPNEIINKMDSSSKAINGAASNFDKFLTDNKEPVKYEEPSKNIVKTGKIIGDFFNSTAELIKKVKVGELTQEEADKKFEKLNKEVQTKMNNIDVDKLNKFMKKEGINYEELKSLTSDATNSEDNSSENINSLNPIDNFKQIKQIDVNKVIKAGPAELTINKIELGEIKVSSDNEYNFSYTKSGEKAQIVILDVTLKNTTEKPANYYADQAEIMTNTGEQLEPSNLTGSDLVSEMKGPVKSSGKIVYELKETKVNDLSAISYIAKPYYDEESGENISEEQIIELPIK